jgi:hypothetical protein
VILSVLSVRCWGIFSRSSYRDSTVHAVCQEKNSQNDHDGAADAIELLSRVGKKPSLPSGMARENHSHIARTCFGNRKFTSPPTSKVTVSGVVMVVGRGIRRS